MTANHNDDKNFMMTFGLVLIALVGLTIFLIITANVIGAAVKQTDEGDAAVLAAKIADNVKPVGVVALAGEEEEAPELATADAVAQYCGACHSAGVAGAPTFADTAGWNARLTAAGGLEGLVANAINGKGGMPPRGGSPLSDSGMQDAVIYILDGAGIQVEAPAAAAPAEEAPVETAAAIDAEGIYNGACAACHAAGVAGSPKLGDVAGWAPRIQKGIDALVSSAINGIGIMPAKGGRADLSDAEIKAVVEYMVANSQ